MPDGIPGRRRFPLMPRRKRTEKTHYGHVLVLAGSRGMMGAGILAARAALSAGSGLVTMGVPESFLDSQVWRLPEVMTLALAETKQGSLSSFAYATIRRFLEGRRVDALAAGPGLSVHPSTVSLVRRVTRESRVPVVLDGDGLNSFRGKPGLLRGHASGMVLTPHAREFERLFSEKFPGRLSERGALAKRLSKFYDVVLVSKGHPTLVADQGKVYTNTTGNPGMATAGSGDVLAGIIAAFIAQGLSLFQAACWAVYFHGRAGDIGVRVKGELGLTAADEIDYLPKAFLSKD